MSRDFELLESFERQDSLCYISPQTRLLNALELRNLERFKEILRSNQWRTTIDINYNYEEADNKTLLEIACSSSHTSKFVEALLSYSAEVNAVNLDHKKSPLHLAIEYSDFDCVTLLIEHTSTNVNIRDSFGNTPLHKAAQLDKADIVDVLLQHPAVKVNAINRKKQTPLHIAATKGNKDSVKKLVDDIRVDLDELKDFTGQTCRDMIRSKLPTMELQPAKRVGKGSTTLFSLLHDRDVTTFKERCKQNKAHLNEDDGRFTYLQYACQYGLLEAVKVLLEHGANPNVTCHQNQKYPIMLASYQGYLKIVQALVEHGNIIYDNTDDGTVLHAILNGITKCHDVLGASFESANHMKCLEYLLQTVPADVLNINAQNHDGNTALHLAAKIHDKKIIRLLLDHGAYIGSRCNAGTVPIALMDPDVLKEYLDDCVVTNDKRPIDESYEIIYKYNFLVPPKICLRSAQGKGAEFVPETEITDQRQVISETEPLIEMSKIPELRQFLKHPVLTSFLNLKWYTIRKYFWVNLSFYLAFWLFLTFYVLTVYSIDFNDNEQELEKSRNAQWARFLWKPTLILCFMLFLREFFQFSVSPTRYLCEIENFLEIALIVSSTLILFCEVDSEYAAVAILLSWAELVLLIGRHPSLSTNIEMFKVVCTNFLKLLAWYSILILAFALSFYLLFKDARKAASSCASKVGNSSDDNAGDAFFEDPTTSIFKSVIMLTGEFDASSIPFTCHPGISHVLFVLFVFLIAIVLFNLLNGLAVSDTQAIRSDAEIVGNVCRAKLITYIEKMATGDPFAFLSFFDKLSCMCCCVPPRRPARMSTRHIKLLYQRINLFPHVLPDMQAHVLANQGNLVDFSNSLVKCQRASAKDTCFSGCGKCTSWVIEQGIMKLAKEILLARSSREEFSSYSDAMKRYSLQMEEYKKKLNTLEQTTKRNEDKLIEVIKLLKQRL